MRAFEHDRSLYGVTKGLSMLANGVKLFTRTTVPKARRFSTVSRAPCTIFSQNTPISKTFRNTIQTPVVFKRSHYDNCSHEEYAHVGAPAPDFHGDAVVGNGFQSIKLSDYKGKYVVLFWYPLDFTFVCPTEIVNFSDRVQDFKAINCEVIGASCDSKFTHLAWVNTPRKEGGLGHLDIPLLADFNKEIAYKYGALFLDTGFPMRATYIIDSKGTIRHISFNDPPVGRSVDEVLRLVQAYQHTDKHGEVCPSGWKPGTDTMKADPVKSKEYFSKHNK